MRTRFLTLAGLAGALAVLPATVEAQDAKKISFGVMGGLSLPMGNLGDAYDSGYNLTGSIHAPLGEKLRLRGDVGYESFGAKGSNSLVGANFNVLSFTGNLVLPLGQEASAGGIRPYVIGGLGFYRTSFEVDVLNVSRSESNTDLGITLGGGVEFKLSGFTTFAELRFTNVWNGSNRGASGLTDDANSARWVPLTFGVRF